MTESLILSDYETLRDEILQVIAQGKARAQQAVEREKVNTYWEIGSALHAHFSARTRGAAYGEQVAERLSDDLGMSERLIYDIVEFYKKFKILHARAELTWTHYRRLLVIPDAAIRRAYTEAAAEQGWSSRELSEAIKNRVVEREGVVNEDDPTPPEKPPVPRYGSLHTYRIVWDSSEEPPCLDLGFGIRYKTQLGDAAQIDVGMVMVAESVKTGGGYRFHLSSSDHTRLYTHAAPLPFPLFSFSSFPWADILVRPYICLFTPIFGIRWSPRAMSIFLVSM